MGIGCEPNSVAIVETNLNQVPMSGGKALAAGTVQKSPVPGGIVEPITLPLDPGSRNTKETINYFQVGKLERRLNNVWWWRA